MSFQIEALGVKTGILLALKLTRMHHFGKTHWVVRPATGFQTEGCSSQSHDTSPPIGESQQKTTFCRT
jgi:hypothetical protein